MLPKLDPAKRGKPLLHHRHTRLTSRLLAALAACLALALPQPRVVNAVASLPSDRSFGSYEEALAHVQGPPLAAQQDLYWNQLMLDVLLEYPITSERSKFAISFPVDRLGRNVTTAL